MALPNRHEFLAQNLTTLSTPPEDQKYCPIGKEELINAVRTPCGHIFCRECLTFWLVEANTCPTCRRKLFEERADDEEEEDGRHSAGEFFDRNRHPDQDNMYDVFTNRPNGNRQNQGRLNDSNESTANAASQNQPNENATPDYPNEIDWPENIEPFDPRNFDPEIDGHELPSAIEDFDAYLARITILRFHPLLNIRLGGHEVHVDPSALILSTIACASRLSSNPNLNTQDPDAVYIHALCNNEWSAVVRTILRVLPAIAQREQDRRAILWPGPSAMDLYTELRLELFHFPRVFDARDPAQLTALEQNVEVMRFRRDVDCLLRWIVTKAAIGYRVDRAMAENERFDGEEWWDELLGLVFLG